MVITVIGARKPFRVMKMEIISEERTYEGMPALPSLVMAVMESSGIRGYIDACCGTERSDGLFLTSGMAVKALIGTMVERGKRPLYRVSDYYSTAPVDKLFGIFVKHESLSDTVIANRLDTVFNLNTEEVLYECYKKLREKYGFSTKRLFLDATNYTMFGIKYAESQLEHNEVLIKNGIEIKESPMPAYGGNAKDKNNDRVQMNLSCAVDENGIPLFGKSYDGNDTVVGTVQYNDWKRNPSRKEIFPNNGRNRRNTGACDRIHAPARGKRLRKIPQRSRIGKSSQETEIAEEPQVLLRRRCLGCFSQYSERIGRRMLYRRSESLC